MTVSFLDKIIFGAKRIAYQLKEKPKASIDDHSMEHMIFYHGLTGSSPENEKETKLVRADIKEALDNKSSTALSLALKLSPAIWQDRLSEIISQLTYDQKQLAIKLLTEGDSSCIAYPDWRVRANSANILTWLDAKGAAPALAAHLASDTTDGVLSFCYIAYALGKLQGAEAKEALQKNLDNENYWLRVDAAGALAYFDFESAAPLLAQALLDEQEGLDYMAYAISRQLKPAKFLQRQMQRQISRGGCRLIYGIIEAAQNSFNSDLVFETECHFCLPQLMELIENNPDPILVDTAFVLYDWLNSFQGGHSGQMAYKLSHSDLPLKPAPAIPLEAVDFTQDPGSALSQPYPYVDLYPTQNLLAKQDIRERVLNNLKMALQDNSIAAAELTHTIKLGGRLKVKEAQPLLCQMLSESGLRFESQINYLIAALGEYGDGKTSSTLIDLANRLVNVKERCQKQFSKQPVYEDDPAKATTYWQILKALGDISTAESVSFLFESLADYAPDKRAAALTSLMAVHKNNSQLQLPETAPLILRRALKDPSPIMQLSALAAIVSLEQMDLIADILPLIDAQANTVSKQALAAIACLYKSNKLNQPDQAIAYQEIKTALQAKLKMTKEEHKKMGIMDILREYTNTPHD